jgi:MoaA/NifB/PqqE/SkfB family radical SAM enzyme
MKPPFSTLEIKASYSCNSRCIYCCAGSRQKFSSMTFDDIMANVDYFMETHGITEVCLSGGEPSIRPDFLDLLSSIRGKGLTIYLHTNAIKFHERKFAEAASRHLDRALVGFSAHDADLCEALTKTGKTFERRLAGARNLLDASVPVRTNTVILRQNFRQLPEIAEVICSLGVRRSLLTFPFFIGAAPETKEDLIPDSFEEVRPFLAKAVEVFTSHDIAVFIQGLPPCKLGEFGAYREIDPDRALVDSLHQCERHQYLFREGLGYHQTEECRGCEHAGECWGFPKPGVLGNLGRSLGIQ